MLDVNAQKLDPPAIFLNRKIALKLFKHRCHHLAGSAPIRKEVNDHERCLFDVFCKRVLIRFFGHLITSSKMSITHQPLINKLFDHFSHRIVVVVCFRHVVCDFFDKFTAVGH